MKAVKEIKLNFDSIWNENFILIERKSNQICKLTWKINKFAARTLQQVTTEKKTTTKLSQDDESHLKDQ